MYVFGRTTFSRHGVISNPAGYTESFTPRWKHVFRMFTVKAGQRHWFSVSNLPLIFINFATFVDGKTPTSAATDFHSTT